MSAETAQREVAYRVFAAEYEDTDYTYSEGEDERAPNYVVTPTGARVNRLFVVGVLTEVEAVGDDILRARVVDPTGAFVLYAGQYQPDEQAFLDRADPPAFVAVTGKARTFSPEDSDRVYTSVRPESINEVDAETRDRWTVQAAEQTLDRVAQAARALASGHTGEQLQAHLESEGVPPALAEGIPRALEHYGTTPTYLAAVREMALDGARLVAGERDEVRALTVSPDAPGDVTAADLVADTGLDRESRPETDVGTPDEADTDVTTPDEADTDVSTSDEADTDVTTPDEADTDVSTSEATEPDTSTPPTSDTADVPAGTNEPDGSVETDSTEQADDTATDSPSDDRGGVEDESGADLDEFDPGEFDLSEETREEVESEFGTEFQSGTEVDDPGEAGIDTSDETVTMQSGAEQSDIEDPVAEGAESADSVHSAGDAGETGHDTADEGTDPDTGDDGPEDAQSAVLSVMEELDDGEGADRAALVEVAGERHGLTADEVEAAVEDALMDGQCYEPDETSVKPI